MPAVHRIPIPKPLHDDTQPFISSNSMCRTCAYKRPLTNDELEMEKHMQRECAHPCHERKNVLCYGSMKTVRMMLGDINAEF